MRFPKEIILVHPFVCGIRAQISQPRRDDPRTRGACRSFDNQSLGRSTFYPCRKRYSVSTRGRWEEVDAWTRRTSKCSVSGSTCIVRLIGKGTPFIFCSGPSVTPLQRQSSSKKRCANGDPAKVTIGQSDTNKAAIDGINKAQDVPIAVRQIKYLNNVVEQAH